MLLTRAGWSERIVKERWQESLLSEPPAMLEPSGEGGPFSTQKLADLFGRSGENFWRTCQFMGAANLAVEPSSPALLPQGEGSQCRNEGRGAERIEIASRLLVGEFVERAGEAGLEHRRRCWTRGGVLQRAEEGVGGGAGPLGAGSVARRVAGGDRKRCDR